MGLNSAQVACSQVGEAEPVMVVAPPGLGCSESSNWAASAATAPLGGGGGDKTPPGGVWKGALAELHLNVLRSHAPLCM